MLGLELFDVAGNRAAILLPRAVVQCDCDGSAFGYLVGKDNKAIRRKIVADRTSGANWVVTDGLKAGERVITQGIGNLRQGAAIRPVPASSPQRVGKSKGSGAEAKKIGRAHV